MTELRKRGFGPLDGGAPLPPLDILRNAPGVDPMAAIAEGNIRAIPSAGYFLRARVRPASPSIRPSMEVDVVGFDEGNFRPDVTSLRTSTPEHHRMFLNIVDTTDVRLAITKPYLLPAAEYSDPCDFDIHALPDTNGNAVLTVGAIKRNSISTFVLDSSYERLANQLNLNRVVTNPEELQAVLDTLILGAGLSENDREIAIAASMDKVAELTAIAAESRQERRILRLRDVLGSIALRNSQ